MKKIYNVSEFAEMIGKLVNTLQRWDTLVYINFLSKPNE